MEDHRGERLLGRSGLRSQQLGLFAIDAEATERESLRLGDGEREEILNWGPSSRQGPGRKPGVAGACHSEAPWWR